MMEGNDPGYGTARASASKGASAAGKAKGALGKGKALGGKTFLLALIVLVIGIVFGALSLLDPFAPGNINIPKAVLFVSALASLIVGIQISAKAAQLPEEYRHFWTELGKALIAAIAFGLGLIIGHYFLPGLFTDLGSSAFTWVVAPVCVLVLLPTLLSWAFRAAMQFEPERYELWNYPKNYREQQQTWNRDLIVIANFHFKRKENEDIFTTVNVKLPEDAELGELVYLFIKDYNENRYPNAPITELRQDDGSVGWNFRRPKYLLRKQRKFQWAEDILDPKLTIAQNKITRDCDVFFDRIHQAPDAP